eukprot:765222-Hanusia_phi.AAC.2
MPPVSVSTNGFQPPLNEKDLALLSRIGAVFRHDISKALRGGDPAEVANLIDKLRLFQAVQAPVIRESMESIVKLIQDTFHVWELTIKSLKTDFSPQARRSLRKYLAFMDRSKDLEGVMEGIAGLRARWERAESLVKQEEQKQQEREQLQVRYHLETCFSQVRPLVRALADKQPSKFYPPRSTVSFEAFFDEFSNIPECRTLSYHFQQARDLHVARLSNSIFLFGDQLPLDGIIEMYSQNVVSLFEEQVEICKKGTLTRTFDSHLESLREKAFHMVERDFEMFSDQPLQLTDTPEVRKTGC